MGPPSAAPEPPPDSGEHGAKPRTRRRKRTRPPRIQPGQSPGVLAVPPGALPTRVRATLFGRHGLEVREDVDGPQLEPLLRDERQLWLQVSGLGTEDLLRELARVFGIPALAMEDALTSPQRPKLEGYDDAVFAVLRMPRGDGSGDLEQISMFVRGRAVLTFQEHHEETFVPLRRRLERPESLMRQRGIDYTAYRILDYAIDSYFPLLEHFATRLDEIELEVLEAASARQLRTLHELTREVRAVVRVAVPMREVVTSARHGAPLFFQPETQPFLRDVQDHAATLVEMLDHLREVAIDLRGLIQGSLDLRMNQVMRLLTAITAVFIPLSFLTGLYGMNFEHMPELDEPWAYPAVLVVLALIAVSVLLWFRRSGWIRLHEE